MADLEAWEIAIRDGALVGGARVLSGLLTKIGSGRREEPVVCSCGELMKSAGLQRKELRTILGPVEFFRSLFRCPSCGKSRYPGDEDLDIVNTVFSPALRRMMARAGSNSTFKIASEDLRVYAGVEVNAKSVERIAEGIGKEMAQWNDREAACAVETFSEEVLPVEKTIPRMYIEVDGTGVPMTAKDLMGRKGKQSDGTAKTREVKLGCVFTQTTVNKEGFPVRDAASTTFVGKIESAADFGERIFAEALRREYGRAEEVVMIGDGAPWIWNIAETHFPGATQILDLYHAREHVSDLCKSLMGNNHKQTQRLRTRWWTDLGEGKVEKIMREATRRLPETGEQRKTAMKHIAYLEKNRERMRYKQFRKRGLFIGSGVVEAGCKSIIGHRLKQSGMNWSLRGANDIISLRCNIKSGRLEEYWEQRACA